MTNSDGTTYRQRNIIACGLQNEKGDFIALGFAECPGKTADALFDGYMAMLNRFDFTGTVFLFNFYGLHDYFYHDFQQTGKVIIGKLTAIMSDSDSTQMSCNRKFQQEVKKLTGKNIRINPWHVFKISFKVNR